MNSCAFTLPAPAKLNLFLHVVGRRDDGYHLLQTAFTFLERGDEISFRPHDELHLINPGDSPAADDNLIMRAARLLQQHSGCSAGALLRLKKCLPMGGGLGGGSSDAATCLLGLNRLWQLGLSIDELASIGLELGADVPVFVRGETAFAEGIGEQLTPITLPEADYLVLHPGIHVSTKQTFTDSQLTSNAAPIKVADFLADANDKRFGNSCEAVVCRQHPVIANALAWLADQAGNSRLTGTGACIFARLDSIAQGEKITARLPDSWSGFIARSCQTSPLHQALARQQQLQPAL